MLTTRPARGPWTPAYVLVRSMPPSAFLEPVMVKRPTESLPAQERICPSQE